MNRHFKKYYFYLIARVLSFLGLHDKSLSYYSKVIQFRTFFWDVQKRYAASYGLSNKQSYLEIHGGVGDFLQYLPFILKNKSAKYIVTTHFLNAKIFFESLGVKVFKYHFYSTADEHRQIYKELKKLRHSYWCPRSLFFEKVPFKTTAKNKYSFSNVIGLHIGSSKLSSQPLSKTFALKLIRELQKLKCHIILFGTVNEINKLKLKREKSLTFATDKNIIKNLSLVKFCRVLIGGDSVFKTMSSMSNIRTIVFHEDDNNRFRDRVFISPYVKKSIMSTYKYKNLIKETREAIDFAVFIVKNELKLIS